MKNLSFCISEYGVIKCQDEFPFSTTTFQELYLPKRLFEDLYEYILENQSENDSRDLPFTLFTKGGNKQIKVKNYVGIIETKNGLHLEILPKIHFKKNVEEISATKMIFLKMLKHLKNSPFIHINEAHLNAIKDFPILEVFIFSYIEELERLITTGLKSNYLLEENNLPYANGKIKVSQNIKRNFANKAYFYCESSVFSLNIPPNRIIKSTILKLLRLTRSFSNYKLLNKILLHFELVQTSSQINRDLSLAIPVKRTFLNYEIVLKWSEIFLCNKSFTNFQGSHVNISILFPMEKIFENYIAYLFAKHAEGIKVTAQDRSYFLVESHLDKGKFALQPDLVAQNDSPQLLVIDTKWKLINQFSITKNYNISQADMYQLYAYGKKYSKDNRCKLILLYPSNSDFTGELSEFIYEGDLVLRVIPFDFEKDALEQVRNILAFT